MNWGSQWRHSSRARIEQTRCSHTTRLFSLILSALTRNARCEMVTSWESFRRWNIQTSRFTIRLSTSTQGSLNKSISTEETTYQSPSTWTCTGTRTGRRTLRLNGKHQMGSIINRVLMQLTSSNFNIQVLVRKTCTPTRSIISQPGHCAIMNLNLERTLTQWATLRWLSKLCKENACNRKRWAVCRSMRLVERQCR